MNPEAQAILDQILRKDLNALTETDIVFLRARSSYLTLEQRKIYAEVLGEAKPAKQAPKEPASKDPQLTFKELKAIAAEMGLKVPVGTTTEQLADMIKAAQPEA